MKEDHVEEAFPFVVIGIRGVEHKLHLVGDVVPIDGVVREAGADNTGVEEEKRGANWDPSALVLPLKGEGLVPNTIGGEVAAEVACTMEEKEPDKVEESMAAEEEEESVLTMEET